MGDGARDTWQGEQVLIGVWQFRSSELDAGGHAYAEFFLWPRLCDK